MGLPSQLKALEDVREMYDEVRGYVETSPLHSCIVEHTFKIIPEADLEKKVMACRENHGQSYSKKEYDEALFFLRDKSVIDKAMIHRVDGWHYEAPPFIKSMIDHIKKTESKRRNHI